MKLYIRNMVCNRCKMVVKAELEKLGLHPLSVELGEVKLAEKLTEKQKLQIDNCFAELGFELLDDRKSRIVEKVKNIIVQLVHHATEPLKTNLSDHIVEQLNLDYSYISNLFTQVEGTTIEQYLISQKIERVKELLIYDEYSLGEIAFQLNYSSVAHLSRQFKKVTGLTPSYFKTMKEIRRKPIEEL